MDKNKRVGPTPESARIDASGSRVTAALNTDRSVDTNNAQADKSKTGKRRQKRPSPNDNMCRGLTKFDAFGSEYRWNVDGEEIYKTGLGAFCTVLMAAAVAIFAIYVFSKAIEMPDYSFPTDVTYPNYFNDSGLVEQQNSHFFFAVGLSSQTNFTANQSITNFVNADLKLQVDYKLTGGPDDSKTFIIPLRKCTKEDLDQLSPYEPASADVISAHV